MASTYQSVTSVSNAEAIESLISQVLHVPQDAIRDDASFVSLGGDSFKAIRFYQECARLGLYLRFQDILYQPLREMMSRAAQSGRVPIERFDAVPARFSLMPPDYDFGRVLDHMNEKFGFTLAEVEDVYPCSPMQENMHISQKLSAVQLYRARGLFKAHGRLELDYFRKVWADVVQRHQSLRTVFVETSDPGSGRVLDAVVLKDYPVTVTRGTDTSSVEEGVRRYNSQLYQDTTYVGGAEDRTDADDFLHRVTICYTSTGQTLLEFDINHLTVDGSSLTILFDELVRGLKGRQVAGLAPSYRRYIDYLQNHADEDSALDYWVEYLDGAEPCYFPAMNENRAGDKGSSQEVEIPVLDASLERIRAFCLRSNTTVSNLLQAVWALVLHAYTGDADVCFGYLSSGRSLPIPDASEIVGPMMNLLVCRVREITGRSVGSLLDNVRDDFLGALPHQCFSIGKVRKILGENEARLFNTIVTAYHYSPTGPADGGAEPLEMVSRGNTSEFDIVLKAVVSDSQLGIQLAYATATLSPAMAERVSHTFSAFLERLVDIDHPGDCSIRQVIGISSSDMRLIRTWNSQSSALLTGTVCVHELIERQAQLRPGAPALHAWDGEMCYRELNEAANGVARRISSLGIGPGEYVALCFDKSMWYSVALLGVLKSGNGFVPIDVANPTARKREMLQQLGISADSGLVICSTSQVSSLESLCGNLLQLPYERLGTGDADLQPPPPPVSVSDPAYVIFTSGSTGTPKGVVVQHGAYSYAAQAHSAGIHIGSGSRVLQFASYGFDTSIEDHLTTFAVGACLCVPSEYDRQSLSDLASFARRSEANWAHLTPSFAAVLTPALLPTMQCMVLGGEPMRADNIRTWSCSSPGPGEARPKLIQVYGPSECCVTSTISPVVPLDGDATDIGTAVPGCKTWVVKPGDPECLQPVGAVGELLMEGPILAKGYLGDNEEKTSASFVKGLRWAPEKRLYRTGDLVRYDSVGHLHFFGRRDAQIKLRGQRIELGEIERQVVLDPLVRHCLALIPGRGPCAGRLMAVVTLREIPEQDDRGSAISAVSCSSPLELLEEVPWLDRTSGLRGFLAERLPVYMDPELWVFVRAMPKSSSGKLDRRTTIEWLETLTPEEFAHLVSLQESDSPDHQLIEEDFVMRRIWSEILNIREEDIDWNTSFYILGGDSISAMAVSSLARCSGVAVSGADVLRYKTIQNITRAASKKPTSIASGQAITAQDSSTSEFVPLSPIQRLHFETSPKGDALEQQTVVVQVTQSMRQEELLAAIQSLFEVHPMLCARFECHNGEWRQRVPLDSSAAAAEEARNYRSRFHNQDEPKYVMECIVESQASIDIVNGPLAAFDVFQTANKQLLSSTIHHLVVDAVSWRVIFRQLEDLLVRGSSPAREITSFRAWSAAQCEFASQLNAQHVSGSCYAETPAVDVGFWGMLGKENNLGDVTSLTFRLDTSLCVPPQGTEYSILDVIITAVVESFEGVFKRSPVVFEEGHGRDSFPAHLDPSNTVGWFTTFSPIVLPTRRGNTVRDVHEARLCTPHNGLAYFTSRFLGNTRTKASIDRHSPMEITFNYLGSFQQFEKQDSLFRRCGEDMDEKISNMRLQKRRHASRYALVSMLVVPKGHELSFRVEWNRTMRHQEKIVEWISRLEDNLRQIPLDGQPTLPSPERRSTSEIPLPTTIGKGRRQLNALLGLAKSRLELRPSDIESVYPCSPLQSSLILSQQKNTITKPYEQRFIMRLWDKNGGPVDPQRLSAAWKQLVAAHPVLRTVFLEDESGSQVQAVLKSVDPEVNILPIHDTSQQLSFLWAAWDSSLQCPDPLSGGVPHRFGIRTAADGSVYCLLAKNHIITDGTTSRLLIRNLLSAYDGEPVREACPFAAYVDHIYKQDREASLRYWTRYLEGTGAYCFPRLKTLSRDNSTEFFHASDAISDKGTVEIACRKLEVTPSAVFQAAWAVVLSLYLGREDVLFGLLSHGRDVPLPGAAEVVGPVAGMVPMRAHIDGKASMKEIVRAVHNDNIEHAYQHAALSLAEIMHTSEHVGNATFNTIFNYQKTTGTPASGSLGCELVFSRDTSEFDVAISVVQDNDVFRIAAESPAHFMSEPQVERLLATYVNAVLKICAHLDQPAHQIDLSTELDMVQVLEWNRSSNLRSSNRCIHEMIGETTHRQPYKPAISSWDGDLSYAELDDLSDRLAARLRFLGAEPGVVVILCFEKCLWAVVSMLAVARSGAAFVHIDPEAPPKRTESIVRQTSPVLGLASAAGHAKLACHIDTVIVVERAFVDNLERSGTIPAAVVDPSNTLYVCFTSGTTGVPKGVVVPHESFCSAVESNRRLLQMTAESRVLQFTHFCFDASLEETFTVLVAGGCICIPSEDERMSDVAGFAARKKVNWAAFTPSFLRTLDPDELTTSVRFVTVHAEPMCRDLVTRWAPKVHMRPSYGPTECSVTSTIGTRMTADSDPANIGWPVGCHAWVVHPENDSVLVPVGAVGELLLDGPIVSKGYWGDKARTQAAFIEPPSWAAWVGSWLHSGSQRKLYKTGDLVRYAQDGSLLIQRRKDDSQIKIRGQRVELREVQYHLDSLPRAIQHSIAMVPGSGILEGRLVAVASLADLHAWCGGGGGSRDGIVVLKKSDLDEEDLQVLHGAMEEITAFLNVQLPRYMVPDTWLLVRSLPVQPSFKLDRKQIINWVAEINRETLEASLEVQQRAGSEGQRGTATEETIRGIWAEVLGMSRNRIALDQSFFRLGGDSIYAMEVRRLCREIGIPISTHDVLANPTIQQLATVASESLSLQKFPATPKSPEIPVFLSPSMKLMPGCPVASDDNTETVMTCTPLQQRMYFAFFQNQHKPYLVNSLVSLDSVNQDAVSAAWQSIVDRHGILRTVFVEDPASGRVYQKVLKKWVAELECCLVHSEADAVEQSRRHLDVVRAGFFRNSLPPLSLRIYSTPHGTLFLHLVYGHVLLDHVSLQHVMADCAAIAHGHTLGQPPPGFDSYMRHLQQTGHSHETDAYWIDRLKGAGPCLVPTEPALSAGNPDLYATGVVRFSVELTGKMQDLMYETETTLSNLLQFVWGVLLHCYTGRRGSVVFGHLASDRDIDLPRAQDIVGPMLGMMVTRMELDDATPTLDALRALQADNVRGLPHRPLDLTTVERQLGCGRTGLFNTAVNYRKVKFHGNVGMEVHSVWSQDPHEQILVLALNDGAVGLDASLTYYKSLHSEATVKMLGEWYCRILHEVVSGRWATVGDVRRSASCLTAGSSTDSVIKNVSAK